MLWVLIINASMRCFYWAPTTYVLTWNAMPHFLWKEKKNRFFFFFSFEATNVTHLQHSKLMLALKTRSWSPKFNQLEGMSQWYIPASLTKICQSVKEISKSLYLPRNKVILTLFLLILDIPCLCKQCRSRSAGFWRSWLIWICTVYHSVFDFVSTTRSK